MVPAPRSQPILGPITEAAIFLVLEVADGAEQAACDALADVSAIKRTVGFRIPEAELTCVVGIGRACWDRLFDTPVPAELHRLAALEGGAHKAVSTPGDLLFHIRAHRFDLCFELVQKLAERFGGAARVVDEVHGFRSFDERDLLGFVDGTENPEDTDAADAVLIGSEDPAFAGGSYVIVQKYLHDLTAWNALSVEEQELVVGRKKLDDVELEDAVKPANSHVALNTIVDERGRQRQIVRFNMPFGKVSDGEFGTYFIGYARTPQVIEQMLRNMFVGKPPGNYDRILDFSKAVTGSLFYVPTTTFLDDPSTVISARDGGDALEVSEDTGSLGIGSLKGEAGAPREHGAA